MILAYLNRLRLKKRDVVRLEITPPASISKTPEATERLFSVIHGMRSSMTLADRLLRRYPRFSFEIVSTKREGIRYYIEVEKRLAAAMEKAVSAYVPEAKVRKVEKQSLNSDQIVRFKQAKHYIYPLMLTSGSDQHDPLSYVTSAMTKLDDNERVGLQLIVSPIKPHGTARLANRIKNYESMEKSSFRFRGLSRIVNGMLWSLVDMVSEVLGGSSGSSYQNSFSDQVSKGLRPARSLSTFELELMESMNTKITGPLFHVDLRLIASGGNAKEHTRALKATLDGYSVPMYQSFKMRRTLRRKHLSGLTDHRLPSLRPMILSGLELAGLYHFTSGKISRTDNLITSLSRTLPAPISLKSGQKLEVVIGENHHHGITTPIGLIGAERERHMYIVGGTGSGKTTMLLYMIEQDIKNGKGLAVIDPHGDLAETILRHIPENRIKDVIYMNPDDLAHPIGINLLELPEGLSDDDLLREKDLITESTISVMRKIFSDEDSGGHRIEYVLRNAIQTALTLENPTLFTIFKLLNDAKFRRSVTKTLEDENLRNFWKNELGRAGEFQRVKMAAGITAKIGRFLFSASARRMLEQEKSTIDFDKILDEGKILICNFSKGLLGEDTSSLFGTTILAKLQIASLRRARTKATNRRPFYLYVDEFQNFATISFLQMLSEARKYKLFLVMAEQSTSQQDQQRLVEVILANVGTVICFRSGSPLDERMLLPFFSPYINQGEIANLPAYSFYARIAAIHSQEPLSGMTLLLDVFGKDNTLSKIVKFSRKKYATNKSDNKHN